MNDVREFIKLGSNHRLQDGAHVGSEEQFDREVVFVTSGRLMDERDVGFDSLEIDNDEEHEDGSG